MSQQVATHPRRMVQIDEVVLLRLLEVMRYSQNHEHSGDWYSEVDSVLSTAMGYASPELQQLRYIELKEETRYRNVRRELFPAQPLASGIGDAEAWEKDAAADPNLSDDN